MKPPKNELCSQRVRQANQALTGCTGTPQPGVTVLRAGWLFFLPIHSYRLRQAWGKNGKSLVTDWMAPGGLLLNIGNLAYNRDKTTKQWVPHRETIIIWRQERSLR